MRKLILAATAAALLATPAFAKPAKNHHHDQAKARGAYAQSVTAPATSEKVVVNGKLIGQDPDANVRLMLQKDFSFQ